MSNNHQQEQQTADQDTSEGPADATTDAEAAAKASCCPQGSMGPATVLFQQKPRGYMITIPSPPIVEDTNNTNNNNNDDDHDDVDHDNNNDASIPAAIEIESMPCYCTGAKLNADTTMIVTVFTDVYGLDAGHHKVFADQLAEQLAVVSTAIIATQSSSSSDTTTTTTTTNNNNTKRKKKNSKEVISVIVPDLQRGIPILQPWINTKSNSNDNNDDYSNNNDQQQQQHRQYDYSLSKDLVGSLLGSPGMVYRIKQYYPPSKVEQDVFQLIIPFLQKQCPNATKLSCVGFCFGGWVVGRILGKSFPTTTTTTENESNKYQQQQQQQQQQQHSLSFSCGVGIHPSFQPNLLHGELTTTMAERIQHPMLLLPAWNDVDMKPNSKIVQIMTRNWKERMAGHIQKQKEEEPIVSIEFPTMMHGWVSRGDYTDPKIATEQKRALDVTVSFLWNHTSS